MLPFWSVLSTLDTGMGHESITPAYFCYAGAVFSYPGMLHGHVTVNCSEQKSQPHVSYSSSAGALCSSTSDL